MSTISHANSWLFPDGAVFPVVSCDQHPLKIHSRGLLARGILAALTLHITIFGAWLVERGLQTGDLPILTVPESPRVFKIEDFDPPPPIQPRVDPMVTQPEPEAIKALTAGVPEAVPDFQAPDPKYLSNEDWVKMQTPISDRDFSGGDAPVIIDPASMPAPGPDPEEFVPYEEPPTPIQTSPPAYPDMARAAEVEGTVLLKVLVNQSGRVEKVLVISGHPMLDAAALAAVRTWIFKPALQQHRPVSVWVAVPIRFVLH